MSQSFKKDALNEEISKRGIQVPDDIKLTIINSIKVLGNDYIKNNPETHTFGELFCNCALESPCLVNHYKDNKHRYTEDYLPIDSQHWVSELKCDDFRMLISYSPEQGFEFFSRNQVVGTYLFNNFTPNVLLIKNGIVRRPEDYKGVFPYRFVLDCGAMTESSLIADGVEYLSVEDLLQSILGSLPQRSHELQLQGKTLNFRGFDCIYFEKEAKPIEEILSQIMEYKFRKEEVTQEEAKWVEDNFKSYLITSCLLDEHGKKGKKGWEKSPGKSLYAYLYGLKDSLEGDIRHWAFKKRRKLRNNIINFLKGQGLPFDHIQSDDGDKVAFADEMIRNGLEGSIIKLLEAPYFATDNRSHRAMYKIKTSISHMLDNTGEVEDFDAFISGCTQPKSKDFKEKGLFAALTVSIYIKEDDGEFTEHIIGNISGLRHEDKYLLSEVDFDGKIIIKKEYLGKVLAINGRSLSHKELKFNHAVLYGEGLQFKHDKTPNKCVKTREELQTLITVRGK